MIHEILNTKGSNLQEVYDNKFTELKKQYPEYTEEIFIEDIRGTLMRYPLHAHIPSTQILIKRWLKLLDEKKIKQPESGNYILKNESVILKLFEDFGGFFEGEEKKTWLQRFIYPCATVVAPINVDPRVKPGNNRLILIAILAVIQDSDKTNFEFSKFVLERFGIKGFKKAKSDHKDEPKYKEIYDKCKKII